MTLIALQELFAAEKTLAVAPLTHHAVLGIATAVMMMMVIKCLAKNIAGSWWGEFDLIVGMFCRGENSCCCS